LSCAHTLEDVTYENSADECSGSGSLSVFHVVPILEVFRLWLGNECF